MPDSEGETCIAIPKNTSFCVTPACVHDGAEPGAAGDGVGHTLLRLGVVGSGVWVAHRSREDGLGLRGAVWAGRCASLAFSFATAAGMMCRSADGGEEMWQRMTSPLQSVPALISIHVGFAAVAPTAAYLFSSAVAGCIAATAVLPHLVAGDPKTRPASAATGSFRTNSSFVRYNAVPKQASWEVEEPPEVTSPLRPRGLRKSSSRRRQTSTLSTHTVTASHQNGEHTPRRLSMLGAEAVPSNVSVVSSTVMSSSDDGYHNERKPKREKRGASMRRDPIPKREMKPVMVDTNGDGYNDSVMVDTNGDGILDSLLPVRNNYNVPSPQLGPNSSVSQMATPLTLGTPAVPQIFADFRSGSSSVLSGFGRASNRGEIDAKEIRIISRIGSGFTSSVYKGEWRGVEVAVKEMDYSDEMLAEAKRLQYLNHPHVVQCYGYARIHTKLYLILEYCSEGSLQDYVLKRKANDDPLSVGEILNILGYIALSMYSVHTDEFVHRDLAARNVFKQGSTYKLGDFGLVRELHDDIYRCMGEGKSSAIPINWTSPEALRTRTFSKPSDVWSYGVLVWEVLTYCTGKPYMDSSRQEISERILSGELLPRPEACPALLWESLARPCFLPEHQRPSFKDLALDIIPSVRAAAEPKSRQAEPVPLGDTTLFIPEPNAPSPRAGDDAAADSIYSCSQLYGSAVLRSSDTVG